MGRNLFNGSAAIALTAALMSGCSGAPTEGAQPSDGQTEDELQKNAFASSVRHLLLTVGEDFQHGGDVFSVASATPIENALRGYVATIYKDDPDTIKAFTYKIGSHVFESDGPIAGTVSNNFAWNVIENDLNMSDATDSKANVAKAKKAFDTLTRAGAVFGFDGSQQSGCAAPTDFLLVIDPKGKKVYTIELTPCSES